MKNGKKILLLGLLLLSLSLTFAQKRANIWRFGGWGGNSSNTTGLNFNNTPPTHLNDGKLALPSLEGTATYCDTSGNLLFFTNGGMLLDKNLQPTPNGTGLLGSFSSTQVATFVPAPEDDSLIYLFCMDAQGGYVPSVSTGDSGLTYSVIDMRLNGGLGDIIPGKKNIRLVHPTQEKLAVFKHCNRVDYWVITRENSGNNFYAFLVNSSGINAPVITNIGTNNGNTWGGGQLKVSPDGCRIAFVEVGSADSYDPTVSSIQLFKFNNLTGVVSDAISLNTEGGEYGIEFSPDSRKLYVTSFRSETIGFTGDTFYNKLVQFDISVHDQTTINNSKILIADGPQPPSGFSYIDNFAALQLGPDGKIYIALSYDFNLDVINNPNETGSAVNYQSDAIFLGSTGYSGFGLPTFSPSFFLPPTLPMFNGKFWSNNSDSICLNEPVKFEADYPKLCDANFYWDFGDTYTDTGKVVYHSYLNSGNYLVQLVVEELCVSDTFITTFNVNALDTFSLFLPTDTAVCENVNFQLDASVNGADSYLWSTGSTNPIINIDSTGLYTVTVEKGFCTKSDSTDALILPVPKFLLPDDSSFCQGDSLLLVAGESYHNYLWSTGSNANQIYVGMSQVYTVNITDTNNCLSISDTINIEMDSSVSTDLLVDTFICNSDIIKLFAGNNPKGTIYAWSTLASSPSININTGGFYDVTVTNNTCTENKSILVNVKSKTDLNLGKDSIVCADPSVGGGEGTYTIILEGSWNNVLWNTNDTITSIVVTQAGTYFVQAFSDNGCLSSDTIAVVFDECLDIKVPNSFSPNNDGLNDVLSLLSIDAVKELEKFEIFDRWGNRVFFTNSLVKAWDGNYKGHPAGVGMYIYNIKGKMLDDAPFNLTGQIALIR